MKNRISTVILLVILGAVSVLTVITMKQRQHEEFVKTVQNDIQSFLQKDKDLGQFSLKASNTTLVHDSGNKWVGTTEVCQSSLCQMFKINVTKDSQSLMWEFVDSQQLFVFVAMNIAGSAQ